MTVEARICAVEGCKEKHHSHGYCNAHAMRFRKHGDPLAGGATRVPLAFQAVTLGRDAGLTDEHRVYVEECVNYLGLRMRVDPLVILAPTRGNQRAVEARQLLCYALRQQGWGLKEIGAVINRDHATVHGSVTTIGRRLKSDVELRQVFIAMPRPSARVFTEPSLVEKYDRLTELLAEARRVADSIQKHLASEGVPRRSLRVVGGAR